MITIKGQNSINLFYDKYAYSQDTLCIVNENVRRPFYFIYLLSNQDILVLMYSSIRFPMNDHELLLNCRSNTNRTLLPFSHCNPKKEYQS